MYYNTNIIYVYYAFTITVLLLQLTNSHFHNICCSSDRVLKRRRNCRQVSLRVFPYSLGSLRPQRSADLKGKKPSGALLSSCRRIYATVCCFAHYRKKLYIFIHFFSPVAIKFRLGSDSSRVRIELGCFRNPHSPPPRPLVRTRLLSSRSAESWTRRTRPRRRSAWMNRPSVCRRWRARIPSRRPKSPQ